MSSSIQDASLWSVLVTQSCPTLRHPMDCSPPGSSAHGIWWTRTLEGFAVWTGLYFLLLGSAMKQRKAEWLLAFWGVGGGLLGGSGCWWVLAEVSGWCRDGRALSCLPQVPVIEAQGFRWLSYPGSPCRAPGEDKWALIHKAWPQNFN